MMGEKQRLLDNLINSITMLTNTEGDIFNYCQQLDVVQQKICDIEHYLEDHVITRNGAINLINLLQQLRIDRRQMKQMWELWNTYGTIRGELTQKDRREFLITELQKRNNDLETKYNYKQFDVSYLDELNEDIPLPKGRKLKKVSYNNIEEEDNGKE